jgi:hypothetical protein
MAQRQFTSMVEMPGRLICTGCWRPNWTGSAALGGIQKKSKEPAASYQGCPRYRSGKLRCDAAGYVGRTGKLSMVLGQSEAVGHVGIPYSAA